MVMRFSFKFNPFFKLYKDCLILNKFNHTFSALKLSDSSFTHILFNKLFVKHSIPVSSLCTVSSSFENDRKFKILQLEVEVMKQEGFAVPSEIKSSHWQELLSIDSRHRRRKYLHFLFIIEKKKENLLQKKIEWREQLLLKKKEEIESNKHIIYGLGNNSLFLRIYETSMNAFYNSKLMQAMLFGQELVVDCSYENEMSKHEKQNCAKQIMLLFSENRVHQTPFNLYLCNAFKESDTIKYLHKFIPTLHNEEFPLNITEKSYLDMFPKKKLVYLTPHCKEELLEFSHEDVYIIGAMVDKSNHQPLSLAKAKQDGLRMAKLPLDQYLDWGPGSGKSLTLNQMIKIMLDVKETEDWNIAFKHVPRRKLDDFNREANERRKAILKSRELAFGLG